MFQPYPKYKRAEYESTQTAMFSKIGDNLLNPVSEIFAIPNRLSSHINFALPLVLIRIKN